MMSEYAYTTRRIKALQPRSIAEYPYPEASTLPDRTKTILPIRIESHYR